MAEPMPPLRFVAQPKASYRARYMCEGRPHRHRSQRFVRADDTNPDKYVYPTVEIPSEWIDKLQQPIYIRLSHVTVPNKQANVTCIHPYPIDTEDSNVIKDPATNSLFFPVSDDELAIGRKSFQFTLYKLTQYQLRTYGSLQLLDSDGQNDLRLEDPTDPRKIIETYQLAQSQLLCSIANFKNNQRPPIIYAVSSVFSQIMTAVTTQTNDDEISVRCSPQRGDPQGSDEILMVIPKIDKRKAFSVRFDHPSMDQRSTVNMVFVDTKTILFYSPPCPVILTRENPSFSIPIVVKQNNVELARIPFVYQSMDTCLTCNTNKRSLADFEENDDVNFNDTALNMTINQNFEFPDERNIITAVRVITTNNIDQFSVLENAIEQGDIDLALKIINQTQSYLKRMNDQGETPLLIAAKTNQDKLIIEILSKQLELAKQVDKQGNNLLHFLANIPGNQAGKTIDNVLMLLDGPLKDHLISGLNQKNETPEDLARKYGNVEYIDLFNRQIRFSDNI